jgi:cellulose synthase/poly-beta-1,6-N-acetylglucosamine synthase-like glycosyltransferase
MTRIDIAFAAASPRRSRPVTPIRSLLIHSAVLLVWLLALANAFLLKGVLAWTSGLLYVGYDTALLLFVTIQTAVLLRPRAPACPGGARPRLGIVVAAYNEAAALPATLDALLSQSEPAETIILADDGSDDATSALLQTRYGLGIPTPGRLSGPSSDFPTLFWLRLPHRGKATALNAALSALDTEVVVTVDADTLLAPTALAALRDAFAADARLVAATGIIVPICAPGTAGRVFQWFQTYEYMRNFLSRFAWMRLDALLLISGAFAGFRRDAIATVGGFDSDCLVEDYELIHRLRRYAGRHGLDWRTGVVGAATARSDAPANIGGFLRQRRRWFGGFLQTQSWYRDMVGDPRYGALGLVMLPVKAIDALQPLYGLTAFGLLIWYLLRGDVRILAPVLAVMAGKIGIDLVFHLWSVRLYRGWIGPGSGARYDAAFLAALIEPFSFQILRHLGAAWGWVNFLSGRRSWGVQRPPPRAPQGRQA